MGRPKLKAPKKNFVFRFSETTIDVLQQLADMEMRSASNMLEMLIRQAAEENDIPFPAADKTKAKQNIAA